MIIAIAPLLALLKEYRRRVDARRRFVRTQRTIDALPHYLRKDLGWPDSYREQRQARACREK